MEIMTIFYIYLIQICKFAIQGLKYFLFIINFPFPPDPSLNKQFIIIARRQEYGFLVSNWVIC